MEEEEEEEEEEEKEENEKRWARFTDMCIMNERRCVCTCALFCACGCVAYCPRVNAGQLRSI